MKKLIIILLFTTICNAQIAKDKQLHFASGFVVSGISNVALLSIKQDSRKAFWVGFGLSVLAGVSKEVYDKSNGGKFDVADLAYTVGGGVFGGLVVNLFAKKKNVKFY